MLIVAHRDGSGKAQARRSRLIVDELAPWEGLEWSVVGASTRADPLHGPPQIARVDGPLPTVIVSRTAKLFVSSTVTVSP